VTPFKIKKRYHYHNPRIEDEKLRSREWFKNRPTVYRVVKYGTVKSAKKSGEQKRKGRKFPIVRTMKDKNLRNASGKEILSRMLICYDDILNTLRKTRIE